VSMTRTTTHVGPTVREPMAWARAGGGRPLHGAATPRSSSARSRMVLQDHRLREELLAWCDRLARGPNA